MAKKKAAKKNVKKVKKAKISAKKRVLKKKAAPKRKTPRRHKKARGKTYSFEQAEYTPVQSRRSGKAGQSGDLQGLSDVEEADSESVDELLEEGQSLEAEVVEGVENAPDADRGPVRTHEVPEDDVPEEYREED